MTRMSDSGAILLIVLIFAVLAVLGFFLAKVLNDWILMAVTVGLGFAGHLVVEALDRGYGGPSDWSSLSKSIVFIGYVLPGVFGFGLGGLTGRSVYGRKLQ